jgi:molecular chaperone HscB
MEDYFAVFGWPRRLGLDRTELQRRFYELSRRYHPDRHALAPPEEQARALECSARLNAAYRTLADPIARAEYLVRLEAGQPTGEGGARREDVPPELLEEMFDVQELLAQARVDGLGPEARQRLSAERDRLRSRLEAEEARLTGPLSAAWDEADGAERPRLLAALRRSLAVRAYLRAVVEDLEQALGEGEGP